MVHPPQLLLTAFLVTSGSLAACPTADGLLASLATNGYEPRTLPNHRTSGANGPPVEVRIQLYLAAIVQVDQKQQLLSVEGYFRQEWSDERLNSSAGVGDCEDAITLDLPVRGVWQPDIYFDNSIREWYGVGSMRIYPDARVWRSVRFNHLMRCPMSFHRLPFDTQRCFILIGSYSWEVSKVNTSAFSDGPVEMPEGYDGTIEWELVEVTSEVTTEWFGTGIHRKGYKYVTIYLSLQRRSSNLIMFVFGTAIGFSLVAYVGLFIPKAAAPARVASSVIPVLIMLNLQNNVTNQLPALSYLTWLTSFLVSMTLFTMSTVFEYGVVSVLMQVEARKIRKFEAFKRLTADAHKRAEEQEVSISMEDIQKTDAAVAYVYKLFDSDGESGLTLKEVQSGFKALGQHFSLDQVKETFVKLGVEGHRMKKEDFHRMLKDIDDYMPGKNAFKLTFWEREPADQVDIVFRWAFIIGLVLVTLLWILFR
ncbi:Glra2 [Symbiodinium sp. CCMP2592]|nr:Glra2 [Symbiodinium sp. CCMP2592]